MPFRRSNGQDELTCMSCLARTRFVFLWLGRLEGAWVKVNELGYLATVLAFHIAVGAAGTGRPKFVALLIVSGSCIEGWCA